MKWFSILSAAAVILSAGPALGLEPRDVIKQGQAVYDNNCADCHRGSGEGLPVKFPALKGNPLVTGDPQPLIQVVLNGRRGKLGQMPAWKEHLNDAEIAAVLTYIRNAWGNQAPALKAEDVAVGRKR
jgi:cytochrome c oxidase subunit 2